MKDCCLPKFLPRSMQIRPLQSSPPHNKEANQTYSETRASWDVRGIESKGGAPGPDVEMAAVGLQQHGAVVDGGGLETPAALETWAGRERGRSTFRSFCKPLRLSHGILNSWRLNGRLAHWAGASAEWRRFCLTFLCWALCHGGSLIHVFGFATVPLIIASSLWEQQWANINRGKKEHILRWWTGLQLTPGD